MAQRFRIGPGAGSPFLVSVAGVNADGSAGPLNLIFNGNQPPMRVWSTGFVYCPALPAGALPLPYPTAGPGGFVTPAGTYPLFIVAFTNNPTPDQGVRNSFTPSRTVGGGGAGGLVTSDGTYWGINMTGNVGAFSGARYSNFCILRNYG